MAGPLQHRLDRMRPDAVVVTGQSDGNDAIECGLAGHDEGRTVDVRELALNVE